MQRTDQYSIEKILSLRILSFILFFLLLAFNSSAQFNLHLKIRSLPATHTESEIFVAGNFNGWNPAGDQYRFRRSGDSALLDIPGLKPGEYQFKFTRSDWKKVEVSATGENIGNRVVKLTSDTSIEFSIEKWADDFEDRPRQHSASSGVQVMDTAFFIPQLNRTRKIWIYLPPGYAAGKKRYPVLYMHDGQNIFDDYTAVAGEWAVDECLDSLIKIGKPASIVVAIDNGPGRINEYDPYDSREFGEAEGEEYVTFLAETLKPFIDKHYKTLTSKENTFIAGSSVGGLISYYAMLRYPDVFGKAGIFSPAFWIAPQIDQLTDSLGANINGQFFFYAGGLESETMLPVMQAIADKLGENSNALIYEVIDPSGKHNEDAWRKWFGEFYLWATGNGLNYQLKTGY